MNEKEKRKRKPSALSRRMFPRSFRYEVKGSYRHVIQAIESLATKQTDRLHEYDVQIFSGALDGETDFTISSYNQIGDLGTNRSINAEAYGHIREVQPGTIVVEGCAFMGEGSFVFGSFIMAALIIGASVILFHLNLSGLVCGCLTILLFLAVGLLDSQASFEDFFKDLLTSLKTYSAPIDEEPVIHTSALETPQSRTSEQ